MLRIVQSTNPSVAKRYFAHSDYYSEGQELAGRWFGAGAERLGLRGLVQQPQWEALCDNRNPENGECLTIRHKANRRVGYDFTFNAPKSVSLVYALTEDERIMNAFRESVGETMRQIESEMKTRVRSRGRQEDRITGNIVGGEYIHLTARPVDGIPDPHLHSHCFVFNATYDESEQRWKAGQFADLKRDGPYFEAVFHAGFAARMAELGYGIERTRAGWEVTGVPQAAIREFSRRTRIIESFARDNGIVSAKEKDKLGATTRERKQTERSMPELREAWADRLSAADLLAIRQSRDGGTAPGNLIPPREAAKLATQHCFERTAVVPKRILQAEALKRAYGAAPAGDVLNALESHELLSVERDGRQFVTTPAILAEEQRMIGFARNGRGTCRPLGAGELDFHRPWLTAGQKAAARHVIESPDRVMLVVGNAGVGKTTMMQEAVEVIRAGGHEVFTFAPSANASRGVLRAEGFSEADTVARLLLDERLHTQLRGQVIWVDEAGLLGSRTMADVFALAQELDARVILSGDRKQHGSVDRGAALRLLESEAGVTPAVISEIQRQRGEYKRIVHALSEGRVAHAMQQLDGVGWIREAPTEDRYRDLAEDYVRLAKRGDSAIVVAPTHAEGDRVSAEIRSRLRRSRLLSRKDCEVPVLRNANFTEAERADRASYSADDVLVFHQNARGFKRGQTVRVSDATDIPVEAAARFQVFRPESMSLAAGDVIRITRNGKTMDGRHELANGSLHTVKRIDRKGNIQLRGGWTIGREFGHFTHGYASTSHASQGRSVDHVLIAQSAASWPASSLEQFYVSVSRGKRSATIYTDSKAELLEAVSESEDRPTATELVAEIESRERIRRAMRNQQLDAGREQPRERELVYE